MPLSALQRKVLERYKQFRVEPPTVWRLMSLTVINHAAVIMATGASVGIMLALENPSAAFFVVGTAFGLFGRDAGMIRRIVQGWPALQLVLDWKKLDELLATDSEPQPKSTHA